MITIAIDAMGGDNAPLAIIKGTQQAAKEMTEVNMVLVGDGEVIKSNLDLSLKNVEVVHANDVISNEDDPTRAVKRKESSMMKAILLAKGGDVDAVVSAGNTGAFMAGGTLLAGRIKGIERPALSPILPSVSGSGVLLLDAGANVSPKPEHLNQYAILGDIYARKVMARDNPKIGLLNVGAEEKKGTEVVKKAYKLISELDGVNFVGNVEGRDVMMGACDVVIADGFSGNVLLKTMEGTAMSLMKMMKEEFTSDLSGKLGAYILKPKFKEIKQKMDYSEHGGAPLLGLKKPLIKAHGSSDSNAVKNAIKQAVRCVEGNITNLER